MTLTDAGAVHQVWDGSAAGGRWSTSSRRWSSAAVGDRGNEAATLNNIGLVYDGLGDQAAGAGVLQAGVAYPAGRRGPAREAITLNNIGLVYSGLGDRPGAGVLRAGVADPAGGRDRAGEAVTRYNIAMIDRDQGTDGRSPSWSRSSSWTGRSATPTCSPTRDAPLRPPGTGEPRPGRGPDDVSGAVGGGARLAVAGR